MVSISVIEELVEENPALIESVQAKLSRDQSTNIFDYPYIHIHNVDIHPPQRPSRRGDMVLLAENERKLEVVPNHVLEYFHQNPDEFQYGKDGFVYERPFSEFSKRSWFKKLIHTVFGSIDDVVRLTAWRRWEDAAPLVTGLVQENPRLQEYFKYLKDNIGQTRPSSEVLLGCNNHRWEVNIGEEDYQLQIGLPYSEDQDGLRLDIIDLNSYSESTGNGELHIGHVTCEGRLSS